jgi:hypothetical protein
MNWAELKQRAEALGVQDGDQILISQSSRYAAHVQPDSLKEAPSYLKGHPGQRFWILTELPSCREWINPCEDTGR